MNRRRPQALAATLLLGVAASGSACSAGRPEPRFEPAPSAEPERPEACRDVPAGADLAEWVAGTAPGTSLCLAPGVYHGPVTIAGGRTIWGPREAVIRSRGKGTTVRVEGQGTRLLGVTVDGSGGRFDTLDAAVHVTGADAAVEGVRVVNAMFGILVEKSIRATVRGNHVTGDARSALGLRGDAIRLWETDDSRVEDNFVEHSRDVVIWYSRRNSVRANLVVHGRYGTHFMYSHDNVVVDNRFVSNEVGVFVMYSRGIRLERNLLANGTGAAGMGLGLKESGDLIVRDNAIVHDTIGIYLDTSPLQQDEHNLFERNLIRLCEQGVVFHSGVARNAFVDNTFVDNGMQVHVEGGGDAMETKWERNAFDDYAGYDMDRDGFGDAPYELRSLSSDLMAKHPELAFFRGSPVLALVRTAGEVVPLLAPKTLLRDERPRMSGLEIPL